MREQINEYLERSSTYWRQALEYQGKGNTLKTTELAWGSIVQAITALALTMGKKLRRHREIRTYVRDLASQLGDKELVDLFTRGEAAHANFYQDFMDQAEVREVIAEMAKLLEKIQALLGKQT